jgi:hypothetical protein
MNDFSILVAQWSSAGNCLYHANSVCGNPSVKLVEMVTMGGKSHFIFRGTEQAITEVFQKLNNSKDCEAVRMFHSFGEKILEIYYSLVVNPVRKSMAVIESNSLPDLFQVLFVAIERSFDVVDFYWPKNAVGKGCCLLTATDKLSEIKSALAGLSVEVNFIDSISSDIEHYFDLTASE